MPALTLLVIYTADLERARAFYGALGLNLTREQHGTGPAHYAAELETTVFEIYPAREKTRPEDPGRLGFRVRDLSAALERLDALGVEIKKRGPESALVADPDGRRVELSARN